MVMGSVPVAAVVTVTHGTWTVRLQISAASTSNKNGSRIMPALCLGRLPRGIHRAARRPAGDRRSFCRIAKPWAHRLRECPSAAMLDFNLSKRTDVYLEVDYTRSRGAWIALNSAAAFASSGNTFGYGSRLGAMVGIRHKF